MVRKRFRKAKPRKILSPLLVSTFRQERKSYFAGHRVDDSGHITVASYNVHKCVGLDGKFDPRRTMTVISELGADLVALQEVDQRFGRRAGLLDLHALERETGLAPVLLRGHRNSHGWHGNLVLVRDGSVTGSRQIHLPGAENRGALVVDLTLAGGPLRIIAAHLGLLRHSRAQQVRTILSAAETKDGRPTLLMGDLNEWRLGRRSSLSALEPAFGPLKANVASFPSQFPVWSLDRILANPHNIVSHIKVHDTPLARIASDHLPIKAAIQLDGALRPAKLQGLIAAA